MTDAFTQGLVDMATARNDGIYDAEQRTLQTVGPNQLPPVVPGRTQAGPDGLTA
ncbi:hypothetical protein NFX46_21625 [Streptomyces phaeoluteigriseus]|uniref:Uncharacterized protein n=1 Tax=Streptomyces phaeoluteigriseus TaxID=114686 RepID=A0ABY4ZAL8_9ACTN|nr:hypothetical protein [Streptomyces phaeoluteigriseus]USQ86084.1 hypothetical protein NFX46_21625 [Streptomyces phaeoluteigriseus]